MIDRDATDAFIRRQQALLQATYDEAWQRGVSSYEPAERPPHHPTPAHHAMQAGAHAGAGALLLRRRQRYIAPHAPDDDARAASLEPAMRSLEKMRDEIPAIVATDHDVASARLVVDSGVSTAERLATVALDIALQSWVESNAYRLNAGESVAWAGEQQGFAAAADSDGMALTWVTEDDDSVCVDCQELGDLDPMPLGDWPTVPGGGGTDCDVGCRCTFESSDVVPSSTPDAPVIDRVAGARSDELDAALA